MLTYSQNQTPKLEDDMRKVLFIGIQRFFLRGLLSNLSSSKMGVLEDFLANSPNEAIEIAKNNPDICAVIFMGYITGTGSENPFRANVGVAIELDKILSKKVMIAATGDERTDVELMKNGCTIHAPMMEICNFLQKNI